MPLLIVMPDGEHLTDANMVRRRLPEEDHLLFDACLKKAEQYFPSEVTLFLGSRVPLDDLPYKHPGWLEYGMRVDFTSTRGLYLGCIQRSPGEAAEFHS